MKVRLSSTCRWLSSSSWRYLLPLQFKDYDLRVVPQTRRVSIFQLVTAMDVVAVSCFPSMDSCDALLCVFVRLPFFQWWRNIGKRRENQWNVLLELVPFQGIFFPGGAGEPSSFSRKPCSRRTLWLVKMSGQARPSEKLCFFLPA